MKLFYTLFILAFFCILKTNAQSQVSTNLPIIKVNTNGNVIYDEPKILADLEIINNGSSTNNSTDKPNIYAGKVGIEYRGSTSQDLFPKKPFGLELWVDSTQKSRKVALLGMPEESDWVLNATYNDKTLMRDVLSYDLANRMGRYATRTRYCELMLNNQYHGLYILMEKIKRDKNRVDVSSLKTTDNSGDDVTGGYILKIDKTEGSISRSWRTNVTNGLQKFTIPIQIEYPKMADITDAQFNYIKDYVTEFETSLLSTDFKNSKAKWRDLIDLDSFIDYFLITEFTKNVDGYRLSTYFYKDKNSKGGKLKMGPAWDYNLAFGNAYYHEGYLTSGWQYKVNDLAILAKDVNFLSPNWWEQFAQDSTFKYRVANRWGVLRNKVLSTERINNWIDSTAKVLQPAMERNNNRWTGVLGKSVWPNYYVGATYQDELNWMKEWIRQRSIWLDGQFKAWVTPLANENEISREFALKVFPNPYESETTIEYIVAKKGKAKISIYDFMGRLINVVINEEKNANTHQIKINNEALQSGTYIIDYQLDEIPAGRVKMIKK
ncbi:putative secreted protein (Por secretion system target) [Arcicella aurantiaca]|uniref:Putative secreted protein (Por secretion system target) n=1 Tax=Arcicella aurantiaca TaxID=591202 RepID=A0A316EDE4_9BACT|nr:CotH kinase family protein [Arcicella aurantiaca]PWK28166.1 putative secreted protein (Por secretion system target) [Arcicella aurantiaca]